MKHYIDIESDNDTISQIKNLINDNASPEHLVRFASENGITPPDDPSVGVPIGIIIDVNKFSAVEKIMWEMFVPDEQDVHEKVTDNQELNQFLANAIFNGVSEDLLVSTLKKTGINPPNIERPYWGLSVSRSKNPDTTTVEWC